MTSAPFDTHTHASVQVCNRRRTCAAVARPHGTFEPDPVASSTFWRTAPSASPHRRQTWLPRACKLTSRPACTLPAGGAEAACTPCLLSGWMRWRPRPARVQEGAGVLNTERVFADGFRIRGMCGACKVRQYCSTWRGAARKLPSRGRICTSTADKSMQEVRVPHTRVVWAPCMVHDSTHLDHARACPGTRWRWHERLPFRRLAGLRSQVGPGLYDRAALLRMP